MRGRGGTVVEYLMLLAGTILFAAVVMAIVNATDNRTPEQIERDRRIAEKNQWCEHKGGVCSRINNKRRPLDYCAHRCDHYRWSITGRTQPRFYEDVHREDQS